MMAVEAFIAFAFTFFLKEDLRRLSSVSDLAMMRSASRAGSMVSDTPIEESAKFNEKVPQVSEELVDTED